MAILALHPHNKNQYRKFPLKQESVFCSDDGYVVPDDIIVGCSITSVYGKHRLYIKQIYFKAPTVRVTIASVLTDEVLGAFVGDITTDFTNINLLAYARNISGTLTIGSYSSLQKISRVLNFPNPLDSPVAEFEESVIFCYTPPAVSSIRDNQDNEIRGAVNFGTLTNVSKTTIRLESQLTALSPETIFNPADKSSYLGNCDTTPIKSINGVYPFEANESVDEDDGNLFLVGVKPVVFYGTQGERGEIKITTPGITLDSLCTLKHKLLPPVSISGYSVDSNEFKNLYYSKPAVSEDLLVSPPRPERLAGNFSSAKRPEYYYWPQFVKEEYYAYWNITKPSVPVLLSLTPTVDGFIVAFVPPVNKGVLPIGYYEYSLNGSEEYVPITRQGTTSPLNITGLDSSSTYSVRIRAVNTVDAAGASSNSLSATTL